MTSQIDEPFWTRTWFIITVVVFLLFYGLYKFNYQIYDWNEKVTVTVNTPYGEKSGFAVRAVRYTFAPPFLSNASGFHRNAWGEAVVVDLDEGKYLFALMAPSGFAATIYRQLFPRAGNWQSNVKHYKSSLIGKGPFAIPKSLYPQLVYFEDINDRLSVKAMDPDDLAANFGQGYALKSITTKVTNEWVTYGRVEQVLTWINDLNGKMLDGRSSSSYRAKNKLANKLHLLRFIRD